MEFQRSENNVNTNVWSVAEETKIYRMEWSLGSCATRLINFENETLDANFLGTVARDVPG